MLFIFLLLLFVYEILMIKCWQNKYYRAFVRVFALKFTVVSYIPL